MQHISLNINARTASFIVYGVIVLSVLTIAAQSLLGVLEQSRQLLH